MPLDAEAQRDPHVLRLRLRLRGARWRCRPTCRRSAPQGRLHASPAARPTASPSTSAACSGCSSATRCATTWRSTPTCGLFAARRRAAREAHPRVVREHRALRRAAPRDGAERVPGDEAQGDAAPAAGLSAAHRRPVPQTQRHAGLRCSSSARDAVGERRRTARPRRRDVQHARSVMMRLTTPTPVSGSVHCGQDLEVDRAVLLASRRAPSARPRARRRRRGPSRRPCP